MSQNPTGVKLTPRPGQAELAWYEWLMLFGVLAAAVLGCALAGRAMLQAEPGGEDIIVIAPTATRAPTRTPLPTFTPTPVPTPTPTPPGIIVIGGFIEVFDAGAQGLSFRAGPGLQEERLRFLPDGMVMRVVDGPLDNDGLTWWKLQNPSDSNDVGWSAANYLRPTNPP